MTSDQFMCATCGEPFSVTSAEQDYYAARGLETPGNCPRCRAEIRSSRQQTLMVASTDKEASRSLGTYGGVTPPPGRSFDNGTRVTVPCSDCGAPASVPFQPQRGRPVYCRKCYNRRRASA